MDNNLMPHLYEKKPMVLSKELDLSELNLNAYNWLQMACIFNKRFDIIQPKWLVEHADIIVLVFTIKNADKNDILEKFYTIYETSKFVNIPMEVLYVPLDETQEEMWACYEKQANWFTLKFGDPLIPLLKYMYEVTCVPQLKVLSTNCSMISNDGIGDLEEYGRNAIITWLSTSSSQKQHRSFKEDAVYYGPDWKYLDGGTKTPRGSVVTWSQRPSASEAKPDSEADKSEKNNNDEKMQHAANQGVVLKEESDSDS